MGIEIIILSVIVLISNTVEAISGFGSTIISVTFGSHFYSIDKLLAVLVPLNLLLSLYIVIRYHSHIDNDFLLKRVFPFMGSGLLSGIVIFNALKSDTLKQIYGVIIIILSSRELYTLLRNKLAKKNMSSGESSFWLILSGIIHGIYASGGPLLVYSMSSSGFDKAKFRSNLSVIWLVSNSILVLMYLQTGRITSETLKLSLLLFPMLPLGIFFGELLHHRLNEKLFRIFVFSLLLAAGFSLVF